MIDDPHIVFWISLGIIIIQITYCNVQGNPELYSMIDDPQENFNVAGESAYAEVDDL